jgi:uncharacterized protein (TIGR00369 family)
MSRLTASEIERFVAEQFPAAHGFATIEELGEGSIRLRVPYATRFLRPGGRISGPTLMTLADTAVYYLVLAALGEIRDTFTVNLDIHFLRPAAPADLIADGRLLKLGKTVAVGTVEMRNDGDPRVVAHATATYSVPR